MKGAEYNQREYIESLRFLLGFPGVKTAMKYGFPAYKVGRKVFCFIGDEGVVIRLPRRRVAELSAAGIGFPFRTPQGWWHEWLVIDIGNPCFHIDYAEFFNEAYHFTLGRKTPTYLYYVPMRYDPDMD